MYYVIGVSVSSLHGEFTDYRMCLKVHPGGIHKGKGSHVSCLMKSPFDEYLKWPFRGEITIQIVNQSRDHEHRENL